MFAPDKEGPIKSTPDKGGNRMLPKAFNKNWKTKKIAKFTGKMFVEWKVRLKFWLAGRRCKKELLVDFKAG